MAFNFKLRPGAKKNGSKSPTSASRRALAKKGDALPDGSFPAMTPDFARRALKSLGRTPPEKRAAVKALVKKHINKHKGEPAWEALKKHPALNMSRTEQLTLELATAPASAPAVSASDGPREISPVARKLYSKIKAKQPKMDSKDAMKMALSIERKLKTKNGK